jgi:hypothetical protein
MLQALRDCARRRSWIQIAAAYAVALQMLLIGFVGGAVDAGGNDAFPIICQSGGHGSGQGGGGNGGGNTHQSPCVLCAVAHVAAILDTGEPTLTATVVAASDLPPSENSLTATFSFSSHYPRGPPRTMVRAG